MRLVEDAVVDGELAEEGLVLVGAAQQIVGGEYGVERLLELLVRDGVAERAALVDAALIDGEVETGQSHADLAHPIIQRRRRDDDQMHRRRRRRRTVRLEQVCQKRYRLARLAKAHFISQYAVDCFICG